MAICNNRKAFHDFFIEDKYEAGVVLLGWEIKAIREGRVQLKDSYVQIKSGELWLLGCNISPLISASTHVKTDPVRTRKLLLHKHETDKLIGKVKERGYSIVAIDLHYKSGFVKAEIALAKGKKMHDKRATEKDRELKKEQSQALKSYRRI